MRLFTLWKELVLSSR